MASSIRMPEVIISSSSSKASYSWSIEDVHTGNVLQTAKNSQSSERTLCLAGRDYLVSGVPDSPVINVWHLAQPKKPKKMIVPGPVTAVAVSHQGYYLVAAIDNKLHLWQVTTGNLLKVIPGHLQRVNCIKFTNDGIHFISGGADGQTLVWTVSCVLSSKMVNSRTNDVTKPTFTWNNHSMGVQDIYIGLFGCKARVATVSSDHTCKFYNLATGNLLRSFFMEVSLVSVTMDPAERFLFLGDKIGDIYCIILAYCNTSRDVHYDASNGKMFWKFSGHKDQVSCLSVSMDGQMLLSGSDDHSLKLWNILSQTCVKTMTREGPITNAFLVMIPPVIKNFQDKKYHVPAFNFETLKRNLSEQNTDEESACSLPLNLQNHQLKTWDLSNGMDLLQGIKPGDADNSKMQLNNEINSIKETNEQMYYYLVETFMGTLRK